MDITKENVLITLGFLLSIFLLANVLKKAISFENFTISKFWNEKYDKNNGAYDLVDFFIVIILIILVIIF